MIIELAGIRIRIQNQYPETEQLCRNYETADSPEMEICVSREDISLERERSAREDIRCGRQVKEWPDGYLETLAVYRRIAERLPEYNTFLFETELYSLLMDSETRLFLETNEYLCKCCAIELEDGSDALYHFINDEETSN